jgi:hypothetical protein
MSTGLPGLFHSTDHLCPGGAHHKGKREECSLTLLQALSSDNMVFPEASWFPGEVGEEK